MKNVTVSVAMLYDAFGDELGSCSIKKTISNSTVYYDLFDDTGLVCMDGETCQIVDSGGFGYELLSTEGDTSMAFVLTHDEYNVGIFTNKQ